MRYPVPIYTLQHHYRLPINAIRFHENSKKLITSDKKIIKFWNQKDGSLFTNIEPKVPVNDVEVAKDGSGLIYVPLE